MLRLHTFAPSHFSEKARWALTRAGLEFVEVRHTPLFHRIALKWIGAGKSVPALVTPRGVLSDSVSILHYADEHLPAERRLYPEDPELRKRVEDFEALTGKELGVLVPRWAYHYLLDSRDISLSLFLPGVRGMEAVLFPLLFPFVRFLMRKGLKLSQEGAQRAEARMERHLALIMDQLGGKRYLFGDRFTAADLTVAALAAPLLGQPGYGGTLVPLSALPPAAQALGLRWRAHPIAQFVDRIYREERASAH